LKAPRGSTAARVGHVIDLMPTCLELAGVEYPGRHGGRELKPLEGESLVPVLSGRPREGGRKLFFEHEGGRVVLAGDWKAVARAGGDWELYHVAVDATETRDLAGREPGRVAELAASWRAWSARVGAAVPAGPGR
jgi:arylsulfatase